MTGTETSPAAVRSTRTPAVSLALAVAAGLCLARAWPGGLIAWWIAAIVCCGAWHGSLRIGRPRVAIVVLLFGWLALAAAWHDLAWSWIAPRDVSRLATEDGVSVRLIAKVIEPAWIVTSPPEETPAWRSPVRTLTTFECRELRTESTREPVSGLVRLSLTGAAPELTCGDVVAVIGKLRLPAEPLNPGDFDYRTWLRSQGVRAVLHAESVESVEVRRRESSLGDLWGRARQRLRARARDLFAATLSPETSGVAETMLLGGRRRFDEELRQAFVESGMLHILAISGVNVALLGLWLTILARLAGCSARQGLLISVIGLVLYAAVTDGDPPVVRATVMALLGAAALRSGRHAPAPQIVAAALLGMMLVRPVDLFDAGAQLSFLSVLTISRTLSAWSLWSRESSAAALPRPESRWPEWVIGGGKLWRESSLVSLGIWLATTPLVAWRFQLISPIGLLLNVALGPLIVVLMWSGYSYLIVGLISPALATPLAALFDLCLVGLIRSVSWASSVSLGHLDISSPPTWWMVGYYAGVGVLLLWGHAALTRKVALRALLVWTVTGLGAGLMPGSSGGVTCRFLAVGHGLSVLIELPDGKTVLYDAGSLGDSKRAARIVAQELRRSGRRGIDAVILSHADADHCNGLPALLKDVRIGSVLIGPGFLDDDEPLPAQIVEQCAARHVPVGLLSAGHRLMLHPDVTVRVLHPSEEFYSEQDNPLSLVTAVEYRGRRLLLTGDVEGDGLAELLRQPAFDCDVLLSPHHGSKAANPGRLAHWAAPRWVVVSTQDGQSEDRLAEAYGFGSDVLATARRGAIECRIDSHGTLTVETFRGGRVAESTGSLSAE